MKTLPIILLSIMILGVISVYSQDHTVTGKVISSIDGKPLNGAEVICWESFPPTTTVRNKNGQYSIQVPNLEAQIYFFSHGATESWSFSANDGIISNLALETQIRPEPKKLSKDMRKIYGIVKSTDNDSPIPGASVVVKGTTIGYASDQNGYFVMAVPKKAEAITVSFVGLKTQDVSIVREKYFQIEMGPDCIDISGPTIVYHLETGIIECYADEEMKKLVHEYKAKRKRQIFKRIRRVPRNIKINTQSHNGLVLHDSP